MSNFEWKDLDMCARCHWRDKDPDLCHGVEPPMKKPFIPENASDCFFVPDSYWERLPAQKQKELEADVRKRSTK